MTDWEAKFKRLQSAVHDVYYSACWKSDRLEGIEERGLWGALRDAAEFSSGLSPLPLEVASIRGKVVKTELADDGARVTVRVESRGFDYMKFFGRASLLTEATITVVDRTRNHSKREGVL